MRAELSQDLPMLSELSRVLLNQKYWVSLESSHSLTVVLEVRRGQVDQGREVWREEIR